MAKEYAKMLAEDNAERPTTELHEANNALVSQMVMEALISDDISSMDKLKAAKDKQHFKELRWLMKDLK